MIGPITLPWPDKALSPNARIHWAVKAGKVKSARRTAAWLTVAAMKGKPDWSRVAVAMTFCPPDARRRDAQNCHDSMKAAIDGIADALGIDDSRFVITYATAEPVKGGCVVVTLAEAGVSAHDIKEMAVIA